MSDELDVLVVGGGLGGQAAALALARQGHEVAVLEAASAPVPDRWGLTLWPPGLRVLDELGVGAEVRRRGTVLERLGWLRADGREWLSFASEEIAPGGMFAGVLPSAATAVLAEELARSGIPVLRGWRITALAREDGRVRVAARSGDGEERRFAARLVVGADGQSSEVRRLAGLSCHLVRLPGQRVFTGVGGGLPFCELRQVVGPGWSISAVPMGEGASWFAVVVRPGVDAGELLRRYAREVDPELAAAAAALGDGATLAPPTGWCPRWEADGVVLLGEAAHPVVPHLGLGGSQTLQDVPVLAEVAGEALARGDTSATALRRFRARRRRTVAYVQRISMLWGAVSPGTSRLLRGLRDLDLAMLGRNPQWMRRFLQELAERGVPPFLTRAAVWLP